MIIEALFNVVTWLISLLFGWLPSFPPVPESVSSSVDSLIDILVSGFSLVTFFIPVDVFQVCVPILIIVFTAEPIYYFVLWLAKKIPLLNIK